MWFARWQASYLGIPKNLFEDYYRNTCAIGMVCTNGGKIKLRTGNSQSAFYFHEVANLPYLDYNSSK